MGAGSHPGPVDGLLPMTGSRVLGVSVCALERVPFWSIQLSIWQSTALIHIKTARVCLLTEISLLDVQTTCTADKQLRVLAQFLRASNTETYRMI